VAEADDGNRQQQHDPEESAELADVIAVPAASVARVPGVCGAVPGVCGAVPGVRGVVSALRVVPAVIHPVIVLPVVNVT
jgi:hypothetical protein